MSIMDENNNKKRKSIFIYFIWIFFIFIVIDLSMMLFANVVAVTSFVEKYGSDLIVELFYAIAILIVMLLFHNSYVFTRKKEDFWNSLLLAFPMLAITGINLLSNYSQIASTSIAKLINLIIFCIFIGIAEEFLCRGWIQNEFLERYSESRKSVIMSIVLSSLVFGLMHISNIGVQTVYETILQIINATALGVLLGSVYYKSKNIWTVIFLHAFYDFAIFLGEINLVKECTYNTPSFGVAVIDSIGILSVSLLWIFSAALVLRKCNFPDKKAKRKNNNDLFICIAVTFIIIFLPLDKLVPEYDSYEVCYTYNEIDPLEDYTEHYPVYSFYKIEGNKKEEVFEENINGKVTERIQEENFDYIFELNENGIVEIENNLTEYKTSLKYNGVEHLEVLENEKGYIVVVHTDENESTIYYSDFIKKNDVRQGEDYLEEFKNSFIKYEFPELSAVGYVTIDDTNTKYPYMISSNNDKFIIKNRELYLIKNHED